MFIPIPSASHTTATPRHSAGNKLGGAIRSRVSPLLRFTIALAALLGTLPAQAQVAERTVEVFDTQASTVPTGIGKQGDGKWQAELSQLDSQQARLTTGSASKDIPLTNLRRLRFVDRQPTPALEQIVTFRDGSTVPVQSIVLDAQQSATLTLGDGTKLDVVPGKLADVRFKSLSEAQQTQWEAMRQSRLAADMLVLVRSVEVLDKIEGVINSITAEAVNFEFDQQQIPAPIARLAGVRFFSSREDPQLRLAAIVKDVHGGVWNAAELAVEPGDSAVQVKLRSGVEVALPLSTLLEIDFSVGSQKYLAELEPVDRSTQPRFSLPIEIAGSNQVFGASAGNSRSDIEFLGGGSVTYRVPAEFSLLRGAVELTPPGNRTTPCLVQVLVEKKVIWEQRLTELGQPVAIDLPVAADQRVQLVVKSESVLPVGDVVLFRELRFLK